MGKAPKFKNRFLKRTFKAPNAETWTFSKNDKRACNQPVTDLNFKDDGKKRVVKKFKSPSKYMQNLHNLGLKPWCFCFFGKKTRLQKRRVVSAQKMRQHYVTLGHEDGNEGQQEDQNCANNGNHNRNVFDDSFNRIRRLV
jgi:hypothetical protein